MLRINDLTQLYLGIQGENKSRTIVIDVADWLVSYPNGSLSIWIRRPGDATATATGAVFDAEEKTLTWQPDNVDTYVAGEGSAEIRLTEGTVIKKTREIRIAVSPAVTGGGSTLGSDWQSYIDEVDRIKSIAVAAANDAEDAKDAAEAAEESATAAASAAETARDAAQTSATAAAGSATSAAADAETAEDAKDTAVAAKTAAEAARDAAQTAKSQAELYKTQASNSASNARTYESTSRTYANDASSSASQAQSSASQAAGSASTANSAASRAETARDAAAESATAAAGSATSAAADAATAEDAKDAAVAAKTAAEAARDAALTMIDDTAGAGDTDKTWSADKTLKEVNSKADIIISSASGSIASFSDGADDLPIKELKVAIDPVQDLHGYDAPWPAGGGKNLLRPLESSIVSKGITITPQADGSVILNGTKTEDDYAIRVTNAYATVVGTAQTCSIGSSVPTEIVDYGFAGYQTNKTISPSESYNNSGIQVYINQGTVLNNVRLYPMIEMGSSATSWVPYENICPITGWTGAKVTRTGVNVWDEETKEGYYSSTNGSFVSYNGQLCSKNPIHVRPSTKYFYYKNTILGDVLYYGIDGSYLGSKINIGINREFTTPNNCYFIQINIGNNYGATYNHDVSINYPSTDTQYHAYSGETYDITFPSEAGTVYGGELTIHADGTGELVVDRTGLIDLSTLSWDIQKSYGDFKLYTVRSETWTWNKETDAVVANALQYVVYSNGYYNPTAETVLYFADKTITIVDTRRLYAWSAKPTVAEFKQYLSDIGAVASIRRNKNTALEYQFSAPQVRTLLGLNHIFADTGDINLLIYPVDTATALDNQTTATHGMIAGSDASVATESHAVGDVFICDNKLYKATDAIAVGESIIESTNVVQTSIAELLLNKPDFVFNASVMKNHPVSVTLENQSRAIVFATGANAERVALISLLGGSSQAYAWDIHASAQLTATIDGLTVTLAYSGSGSCFMDILKLSGNVTATMA